MLPEDEKRLLKRINIFAVPDSKAAALDMTATFTLFSVFFSLMIYGLGTPGYWLTFVLLPFAAILVTRLFTIQHDCGHGSYFSSRKINNIAGCLLGILTLTPYHYWKKNHSVHHAFSGNLDKRGTGDVDTFTVREYQSLPLLKKIWYRLYRNPAFMLIIAPALLFGFKHRLPLDNPFHSVKSWANIMFTNLGIGMVIAALIHFCGMQAFLLVYVPVVWLGSALSVAGFYIQHQYPDMYWHSGSDWKYFDAGLHGSSYFEFPAILNWLVNNINLHHVHHLNKNVPSYRLRGCLAGIPELQMVPKRTLADVPGCFMLALWDDENKKMVGFDALPRRTAEMATAGIFIVPELAEAELKI